MKSKHNDRAPSVTAAILCVASTILFAASIHVLLDDVRVGRRCGNSIECPNNNTEKCDGDTSKHLEGFATSTLIPLSFIPFLIVLMVRYVALRIYLRNWPRADLIIMWSDSTTEEVHEECGFAMIITKRMQLIVGLHFTATKNKKVLLEVNSSSLERYRPNSILNS